MDKSQMEKELREIEREEELKEELGEESIKYKLMKFLNTYPSKNLSIRILLYTLIGIGIIEIILLIILIINISRLIEII